MKAFLISVDIILFESGNDFLEIILKFIKKLLAFLECVKLNQLTINWKKTKFMLLSKLKPKDRPKFT